MAVLDPLKVTIVNLPKGHTTLDIPDFPASPERGSHNVAFSSELYIERQDFTEVFY